MCCGAQLYRVLILDAAEEEFAAYGYADARMQRVAEKVGLSVGTIYNLFENKDALYAAIHQRRASELVPKLMVALAIDEPALSRIARAVRVHVAFCAEHPNQLRLQRWLATSWSSQDAHSPGVELDGFERGVNAVTAFWAGGIARGELIQEDDPRRMVLSMIAVHQAELQSWLDRGMREDPAAVADRIVRLITRMYGA